MDSGFDPPQTPVPSYSGVSRAGLATGIRAGVLIAEPEARRLGRHATAPHRMPWRGWWAAMRRTAREAATDRVSLVAAGCAFYGTLALFPAISMLILLYGLAFDPRTVEPQLSVLKELLPPEVFHLISDRIHQLVSTRHATLSTGLTVSGLITMWSAMSGTKAMIGALNMAYEEIERRGFFRRQFVAFVMTLSALLGAVLAIAFLVALPAALSFVGLTHGQLTLIRIASLAVLVVFVMASLSLLYRYGPSRRRAGWHWVTPGSALATLVWLAVSTMFSFYVGRIASFDVTYGPLAAVVGVMLWFYVTVYVVLLGAELNSELELQTACDTSAGPGRAMGERGAFVADHVAEA